MSKVHYETDEAIFYFDLPAVMERLNYHASENKLDDATRLLNFITESSGEAIIIPDDYNHFGYIALNLLIKGEGSVLCKTCNKIYQIGWLKQTTVGYGKTPLSVNIKEKKGIKRLFGKKLRGGGMLGGRGYECPVGHTLISMITWRT